ncbi:MAG: DUF5119 domain-containing protein [Bacteroidales bacterium]|nr:DUF5119 domain-containing protein [Bacteroidales bacterium]
MSKRLKYTLLAMGLAMLLPLSCIRRPLWYPDQDLSVIVKVLWQVDVYPEGIKPSGITLYFFRDGEFVKKETTANVDSCAVQLEPGRYRLFMISQSEEEFGRMEFANMTDFDRASVSVAETETKWYTRADDENLITNPEPMVAGVSDWFEVSDSYFQTKAKADVKYYTIRVPVYPQSIVSQYWVTIYSANADVLRSVRASTSGMARTFELTHDRTAADEATQFITEWSLTMDDPLTRVGHLDGKITTFGFPNGELPSPQRDSTLNVSVLLVDGKTIEDYVFNVGDKITGGTPPTGFRALYRLIFGSVEAPTIHPPDVSPGDGASGFDATVDDWGDGGDIDVNM